MSNRRKWILEYKSVNSYLWGIILSMHAQWLHHPFNRYGFACVCKSMHKNVKHTIIYKNNNTYVSVSGGESEITRHPYNRQHHKQ